MTSPEPQAAVVSRWLPAPPEVVYDEWTDPAKLAEWMCPRPARCLHVTADPRVGGVVRFDIEEDGRRFSVSGRYLTLARPHLVAFTWSCSTWPDPAIRSIVTVTIEPDGDAASVMTIEHTLLPPTLAQQHARGWAVVAGQLAAAVTPEPTPEALLSAGLRCVAGDLGVGPDVIERTGEDGHCDRARLRAVLRGSLGVVVPLGRGDRADGKPNDENHD